MKKTLTVTAAGLAVALAGVVMPQAASATTTPTVYLGSSWMTLFVSGSQLDKVQLNNTGCPTGTSLIGHVDYNGDGAFDEGFYTSPYSPWGITVAGGPFRGSIAAGRSRAQLQCGSKWSSIKYL